MEIKKREKEEEKRSPMPNWRDVGHTHRLIMEDKHRREKESLVTKQPRTPLIC
jgi:hypothetical protein